MIECPECSRVFKGGKCQCGYSPKVVPFDAAMWDHERRQRMGAIEKQHTEHARAWIERHTTIPSTLRGKDRIRALLAHQKRISASPKPEPKAWAYEIVSRVADGEIVSRHAEKIAREVVGDAA